MADLENVSGSVFIFEDTSNELVGYIDAGAMYDDDWVYITSTETKDFSTDESLLFVNIIVHDTPLVTSLKLEPAVFTVDVLGIFLSSPMYTVLHFKASTSATTAVSNPTLCSSFAAAPSTTPSDLWMAEYRKFGGKE